MNIVELAKDGYVLTLWFSKFSNIKVPKNKFISNKTTMFN